MLKGLESMRPEVIVFIGEFVSEESSVNDTVERIQGYFEIIGQTIRDHKLDCLKDLTTWMLIPSLNDPGMLKIFPMVKLSENLIQLMKGNGPGRIKNLHLCTNPCRLSFRGKEMVFSRFNYFRKLHQLNIEQLAKQQLKQKQDESVESVPDTFRVVKTILHQGSLMPIASINQPLIWSHADSLHLYPHPDFLVLADECEDYHYTVPVNGHKSTFHDVKKIGNENAEKELETVTVLNPGNFSYDKSFTVIYPLTGEIQPSKIDYSVC